MIRKKKEKRKIFFVPIHFLAMLKFIYSEEANTTLTELYTDKQSPKIEDDGVKFKFWTLRNGDPGYFVI